ncbi:MAG: threonine/serine exporter family protein [Hyphomonadaceae bacterium]|nr:threonine/serine exporter family protein [Clostridia bacterium]
MYFLVTQMIYAFFACFFIAYSFHTPRNGLVFAGLTGMLGTLIYNLIYLTYKTEIIAIFVGTLAICGCAEVFARISKMPIIIYLTSGILPLVPGILLYQAMLLFAQDKLQEAMQLGIRSAFIAVAIALAIALPSAIFKIIRREYR